MSDTLTINSAAWPHGFVGDLKPMKKYSINIVSSISTELRRPSRADGRWKHWVSLFAATFLPLLSTFVPLRPSREHGSICAASLLHRAFLFDGLMEEWIQLEKRVENPASSYYHLFITLPVSLAPSFRFLCCPPLLLFNRCIFSVGY